LPFGQKISLDLLLPFGRKMSLDLFLPFGQKISLDFLLPFSHMYYMLKEATVGFETGKRRAFFFYAALQEVNNAESKSRFSQRNKGAGVNDI
jgi:hypothetical protein